LRRAGPREEIMSVRLAAVRRGASATAALAVVAARALFGAHNGYPAERPHLLSGAAWLPSSQVGQLTLLDGSSAEVIARVPVAPAGDQLDAVQEGSTGYVVDRTAGTVRRVEGATVSATPPATPAPHRARGVAAVALRHALYAL